MSVQVDAKTYEVEFPPSANWDTWDTVYVDDVWLDACDFDLKFTSLTSDGGPNIDMVGFDIKDVYRIGAEPAPESSSSSDQSSSSVCAEGDEDCNVSIRRTVRQNVQINGRTEQVNLLGRTVRSKASHGVYLNKKAK